MALPYPSVQSFYRRELKTEPHESAAPLPGDGFTEKELAVTLDPLKREFNPSCEYERYDIGSLAAGPKPVAIMGRVVNVSVHMGRSKSHTAAAGWHHMIVKDNTGAICIKLYFARQPYVLKLGHLLTIWTPFISAPSTAKNNVIVSNSPLTTSIFPGRNASDHMIIHEHSDTGDMYRVPLEYQKSKPLPDLIALKSFIEGGNEIRESKILVCVKSIGARKNITSMKGEKVALLEIVVFDDTAEIVLKLWGDTGLSARDWRPSGTILLLSSPRFRVGPRGSCTVELTHSTFVDVDPQIEDANWLRKYGARLSKKGCIKQDFPEDVWDIDAAVNGIQRVLFTIADVDEFVRSDPQQIFTGFLNVTLLDMNLALNHRRNMLMCTECCGVPVYDNKPILKCKNCDGEVRLELNPKVMGTFIDETGSISPGKLLWSRQAWMELFGRPVEELVTMDHSALRSLEERMLFLRLTLVFGWAEQVGKLAILAVRTW